MDCKRRSVYSNAVNQKKNHWGASTWLVSCIESNIRSLTRDAPRSYERIQPEYAHALPGDSTPQTRFPRARRMVGTIPFGVALQCSHFSTRELGVPEMHNNLKDGITDSVS